MPPRLVARFDLRKIEPNTTNPRVIAPEAAAALAESLKRFGNVQPLVVNHRGGAYQLISGHQRLKALLDRGVRFAPVSVGKWSPRDATALALVLNGHAGRFDHGALEATLLDLAKQGEDITKLGLAGETGFDDALAALAGVTEDDAREQAPPAPKDPITQDAETWELGSHRLVIGKRGLRIADNVIESWQDANGRQARLASTGETFAQVKAKRRGA